MDHNIFLFISKILFNKFNIKFIFHYTYILVSRPLFITIIIIKTLFNVIRPVNEIKIPNVLFLKSSLKDILRKTKKKKNNNLNTF